MNFIEKNHKSHEEMMKAFYKAIEDKCHKFIIVVGIFDSQRKIYDVLSRSMTQNADCFVVEHPHNLDQQDDLLDKLQLSKPDIDRLLQGWEDTPYEAIRLDVSQL